MKAPPTIEVYDQDDNWLAVMKVEQQLGGKLVITVQVDHDAAVDRSRTEVTEP